LSSRVIGRVEDRLREVDRRLRRRYRTAPLGNLPDPLDELIFIQLSIRTREGAYTSTFEALHRKVGGDWAGLVDIDPQELVPVIESGGMGRVKVERIRQQLAAIRERFGRVSLAPLKSLSDREAEEILLALPGVGPKAARCVLLYSLERDVFPVDSHCLRIFRRLGLVEETLDRKKAHDVVQDMVPPPIRHSLHVNMVHHGRDLCRPAIPRCPECPLIDLCPTGQRRTEAADGPHLPPG
jgi:endonuclease III